MMTPSGKWTLSSIMLALAGTTLVGAGLCFHFPPTAIVTQNMRYMGLSVAGLHQAAPGGVADAGGAVAQHLICPTVDAGPSRSYRNPNV
jgi:hypothetical protein